jgi:hypothetical protein
VRQTITGFDATQHFFANHSAEVDGDRAVDTRYMQARHQRGTEHYTVDGYYTGHMVRTPQGWRIARYKLTVSFSDGDRRLSLRSASSGCGSRAYDLPRTARADPPALLRRALAGQHHRRPARRAPRHRPAREFRAFS